MFINKRIISLVASLMIFCTCFSAQVVASVDDELIDENAPSIQVFSDDQISETLCSDEIDIEDFYETTSEVVLPTSCQITEEAASDAFVETTSHIDPTLEPSTYQAEEQTSEPTENTQFEEILPEESTLSQTEPLEIITAASEPNEIETTFFEETTFLEVSTVEVTTESTEPKEIEVTTVTEALVTEEDTTFEEQTTASEDASSNLPNILPFRMNLLRTKPMFLMIQTFHLIIQSLNLGWAKSKVCVLNICCAMDIFLFQIILWLQM